MDQLEHAFQIMWSIVAIGIGSLCVFGRRWFIDSNRQVLLFLYQKTKFILFKRQSEEMTRPYMRLLVPLVGIMLLIVGIVVLAQNLALNS